MALLHLKVGGMHCSLCSESIRKGLSRLDGVRDVQVSLAHGEVLAEYDPSRVVAERLVATLVDLGYTVQEPDRGDLWEQEERELARARRIAFAMGLLVAGSTALMGLRAVPGLRPYLVPALAALALGSALGPARFVLRNAWQSLKRGILNDHVLAAAGALAGAAGGFTGWAWPRSGLPAGAFFAAATYILAFHAAGGYASVLVHVRASQAVRRLLSLQPETAVRLGAGGREEEVPVDVLQPGDRVRVRPGARVPADGEVEEGRAAVDERLVTGEPLPREVGPGDEVIGGSVNLTGQLVVRVTRVGEESFLRRVARQVAEARASKPAILRLVDRILLGYVPAVLAAAAAGALTWTLGAWALGSGPDWSRAALAALGALVMGYPCALGMATPLAMVRAGGVAAARGILMRSGEAFQLLRLVRVAVFDKTGTLTEGRPAVVGVWAASGDEGAVLALVGSAERASEHPLARAVVAEAARREIELAEPEDFLALPGRGVQARVRGEEVRVGREDWLETEGIDVPEEARRWAEAQRRRGATVTFVAAGDRVVGALAFADRLKADAAAAVARLRALGVEPVLASGDHEVPARWVAAQAGIDRVHARLLPEDKRRLVRELRSRMASATVGSGNSPCQCSTGNWLATMVERACARSSTTSRRSRPWASVKGAKPQSSSTRRSVRASWFRSLG
jgi:heavy metal translocating P-type ATPase